MIADGKALAEAEKLFLAARESDRDLFFLNIRYGMFLRSVGRYRAAVPYLDASVRQRPFAAANRAMLAHTLASTGQPQKAEELYDYSATRLRDDGINWNTWISSALFDGAGEPREILKRAPPTVSGDTVSCIKIIVEGIRSDKAKQRADAADRVIACSSEGGSLAPRFAIELAATLGRVDEAFSLASRGINRKAYTFEAASALFETGTRPMRDDPHFLSLVKELGIYRYWLGSDMHPDLCFTPEEREIEVCRELRKDRAAQ